MINLSDLQIQCLKDLIQEKINQEEDRLEDLKNVPSVQFLREILVDQILTYKEIAETLSDS